MQDEFATGSQDEKRVVPPPLPVHHQTVDAPTPLPGASPPIVESPPPRQPRSDLDLTVGSTALGGLFCNRTLTCLVCPDEMRITSDEIVFRSWSVFGFRMHEERLPLTRAAMVQLEKGILWSGVRVVAAGVQGDDMVIAGLSKKEAREIAAILEKEIISISGTVSAH